VIKGCITPCGEADFQKRNIHNKLQWN